jgi:hypothetical protein
LSTIPEHLPQDRNSDQILSIRQHSCGLSAATQTAVLLPILIGIIVPFALLAAEAIAEPALRERLSGAPIPVAGALFGMGIWLVMFGTPAWKSLQRLGWNRSITICGNAVEVTDKSWFGSNKWTLPLHSFEGVSHHIRTSLTETRHELILVHNRTERCLLIHVANQINQNETEQFAGRLGLPVLLPGILFRRRRSFAPIPISRPLTLESQQV